MRRGFTLVELLVVVSVMAVVGAIFLPVFTKVREKGRQTACLSNLRQLGIAWLCYVQDYDDRGVGWRVPGQGKWSPSWYYWPDMLMPYIRSTKLLACPANDLRTPPRLPRDRRGATMISDYALFSWAGGSGTKDDPYYRGLGPKARLARESRPSELVVLTEGWTYADPSSVGSGKGCSGYADCSDDRHTGGGCYAFADGHVKWMNPKEANKAVKIHGSWYLYYGYVW